MGEVVGRHKRGYEPAGPTRGPSWSRRAVVSAPMAVGATALAPKQAWAEPLPLVRPLASKAVHEGYGVCQHVNFQTSVYKHQAEVMERYGRMAIAQMRSMYAPNLSNFKPAMAGARQYGVQWNATVATLDTPRVEIEQRIAHMAANNPDLIRAVEGVNEPNNEGAGWVGPCVMRQKWLHDAVRSHPELDHVTVLGPALHDVRLEAVGGAHWQQLVDAGIAAFMDACAVHNYPSASTPDTKRDERVQWVYDAFGAGYPIKFTEWGYTNTLGTKSRRIGGARTISADASKFYDCQVVLDFANQGWEVMRYEFLDDPDPSNLVTESNFGLWEVQSIAGDPDTTWTPKPAVRPLTALLRSLKDPGAAYTPNPMRLRVNAPDDVRTCLTQKRDGSTTLWLWRHAQVWDPVLERSLNPGSVTAKVERPRRTLSVEVGSMPQAIDLGVPWSARQKG